jgi:hypothetical protein
VFHYETRDKHLSYANHYLLSNTSSYSLFNIFCPLPTEPRAQNPFITCSFNTVDYVVPSDKLVMRMTSERENPQFNVGLTPFEGEGGGYTYNSHSQRLSSLTEIIIIIIESVVPLGT